MEPTYALHGEMTKRRVSDCVRWVEGLSGVSPPSVTIHIDSVGGRTRETFHLITTINQCLKKRGIKVITTTSYAKSSAAFVFLAGDQRMVTEDGEIFLHGVQYTIPVSFLGEDGKIPLGDIEPMLRLQRDAEEFVRSKLRLPEAEIVRFMRSAEGRNFDSAEAVDAGVATEIVAYTGILPGMA